MSKYQLYITAHDGEGISQCLMVWDEDEFPILELPLAAYANDAVISIEPYKEHPTNDK